MKLEKLLFFFTVIVFIACNLDTAYCQSTSEGQVTKETTDDSLSGDRIPNPDSFTPFEIAPQPLPDHSPQPAFPDSAKAHSVTGKVVVQVYVDKKGRVGKYIIKSVKPEGYGFEDEVKKIIIDWQFTPAIQQGKPVGTWISIPFNFKLGSKR